MPLPFRWGRQLLSRKRHGTFLSTHDAHPPHAPHAVSTSPRPPLNILEPTRTILSLSCILSPDSPSSATNLHNHSLQGISVIMGEEGRGAVTVYNNSALSDSKLANPFSIKVGLAQLLRGGAIVEVSTVQQAKLAEEAGACSIVVSEPLSGDGRITRMPDPTLIKEIKRAVSVPVIARSRVGHFVEAQILEAMDVDYIDESEALAIADEDHFINKHNFRTPFICGCRNLGEAFRRIREGAAMIRTQGDLSGGNVAGTVRSVRSVMGEIRVLNNMDDDEVFGFAKRIGAPYDLVVQAKQMGRLPVVLFAAGGIETPADAALMMQLGCDGVFIGAELFDCSDPYKRIRGIVQAVRHYSDPHMLAEASCGMEEGMAGMSLNQERIEDQTV